MLERVLSWLIREFIERAIINQFERLKPESSATGSKVMSPTRSNGLKTKHFLCRSRYMHRDDTTRRYKECVSPDEITRLMDNGEMTAINLGDKGIYPVYYLRTG